MIKCRENFPSEKIIYSADHGKPGLILVNLADEEDVRDIFYVRADLDEFESIISEFTFEGLDEQFWIEGYSQECCDPDTGEPHTLDLAPFVDTFLGVFCHEHDYPAFMLNNPRDEKGTIRDGVYHR